MNVRVAFQFVRALAKRAGTITKSSRSTLPLVSTAGIVAAVLFGGAVSTAFAAASLTPLGDLPGGEFGSIANGVSADGSVVVGTSETASGFEAFRWTSDGGIVGLGYLPGGSYFGEAYGVNGDGSVVVGWSDSDSETGPQAFRWTRDGGMVSLGGLPGGGGGSQARGVNAGGSVIVGSGIAFSNHPQAVRWTSADGMVGLREQGFISSISDAYGVSADGSVVVGHGLLSTAASRGEAFRWTSDGGMVGLGYLPGHPLESAATGVSADGSVIVGYSSSNNSISGFEAFRWTGDGGMLGLGILPGRSGSTAHGVSADGSIVVGRSYIFEGLSKAFYWTADGGMREMWDLLLSHGVDPAADGWTELLEANGISADGNTIVGTGIRNGNAEAFVAVIPTIVPEPGAGALALVGVSSILLLRRRSPWRPKKFFWAPGGFHARRQTMRVKVFAFLAILLSTSAAARTFAAASLTPLGHLPGGSFFSEAYGVSGDGSVVVGRSGASASGLLEAFRWTSDGGMVGLGDLPGGSFASAAYGVSADGSVIVGDGVSDSGQEAFRWTPGGGMVGLGYLPGRSSYSVATGVSADGSVIVGTSENLASAVSEAFRWTPGGGMVGLGYLPGGSSSSAAGVSGDGSVIVGQSESASGGEGFRWTSDGGMVGLGNLPDYLWGGEAEGVSGDGSVVVGSSCNFFAIQCEAFRWTSDGGMVGLGDLPGGEFRSVASGVSADGSVVVGNSTVFLGSYSEAFRWTSDGGMQALWDVLLAEGVDPAADGWTKEFFTASGISADGSTIVGYGIRNDNREAFVAVIPVSSPLPGDFNGDNVVDAADYVVWRKNNIDGESGYNTWRANFGRTTVAGLGAAIVPASNAIPEPAALSLLLFAAGLCSLVALVCRPRIFWTEGLPVSGSPCLPLFRWAAENRC